MRPNFDHKMLESTTKYDITITSKSISMNTLIDHLTKICLDDKPIVKKSSVAAQRRHFLNLISNLFRCYKSEKNFVAYSRANSPDGMSFYPKNDENNPEKITIYHLKRLITILEKNGYLENMNGFIDRERRRSRNSRMRATDKLIVLFDKFKISLKDIMVNPNKPVIVLKNSEKKKITYLPDEDIKKMKVDCQKYNKLLSNTIIYLNGEEIPHPVIHRVFNNSSFQQGGRFYGGHWQECNSDHRKTITINGHMTEEQDYSCFHLRMLYHLKGINPKNDLYSLGDYPRNHVKQTINIALNCSDSTEAKHAILKKFRENDKTIKMNYVKELLRLVLQQHKPVSQYFFSGAWATLQYHDSGIASEIINQFTSSGQIVLPIHDSFIVEINNSEKLKRMMMDLYKKKFHFDPEIVKK